MSKIDNAPSPFRVEQAMSVLLSARARLEADDPDLAADEGMLADILGSDPETCDAMDVLHRVLRAAQHAKDMADGAEARAKTIGERRDRYKRRAEMLRGIAFAAMDALGERRVELPDLTATIAAGRPAVVVTDEAAIPEGFIRTTRAPDKALIGAALKAGGAVPGAEMSNAAPTIQIRSK
jgi:Siphovirus Gp157